MNTLVPPEFAVQAFVMISKWFLHKVTGIALGYIYISISKTES